MKMEQTMCSETSAHKVQTPRNYPEERIQHSKHGENLIKRVTVLLLLFFCSCLFVFVVVQKIQFIFLTSNLFTVISFTGFLLPLIKAHICLFII